MPHASMPRSEGMDRAAAPEGVLVAGPPLPELVPDPVDPESEPDDDGAVMVGSETEGDWLEGDVEPDVVDVELEGCDETDVVDTWEEDDDEPEIEEVPVVEVPKVLVLEPESVVEGPPEVDEWDNVVVVVAVKWDEKEAPLDGLLALLIAKSCAKPATDLPTADPSRSKMAGTKAERAGAMNARHPRAHSRIEVGDEMCIAKSGDSN